MFKETDRKFKETDRKFKETDRKFKETDRKFKETDRKFQETDRKFQETDRKFKETEEQLKEMFKKSEREIRKLETLFVGNWGKLIESLVEGDLVNLLNQRKIYVNQTAQRVCKFYQGKQYEIDIIALNGNEIVFVEVKTTLKPEHVQNFLKKLEVAKEVFPIYKDFKIYGAVAYLRYESEAVTYAINQGLFVIRATGKSASLVNPQDFQPKAF